mmetsp:Transcript_699/g.2324  ORF Transcript_699/g.2324 Transcript_699/m.2324 type:complete len:129 (+) Transcript_699:53-439(+)
MASLFLVYPEREEEVELGEGERERYERPCDNCGRLAAAEGSTFSPDDGGLYCGQNCYWSKELDKTNQRLRMGKKPRRRAKVTGDAEGSPKAGQKAGLVQDSVNDSSNALFLYHAYFCGAYSLRAPKNF